MANFPVAEAERDLLVYDEAQDMQTQPVAGQQAYVTIATEIAGRAGPLSGLECWFVPWLLRPVYARELAQLAAVAGKR